MGITERQLAKHNANIGASSIGALFGKDPFQSVSDVYARIVHDIHTPSNAAMELGTALEPVLLGYASEHLGKIRSNVERRVKGTPILCHIDGVVVDNGEPVEAKTSGLLGPLRDHWGESGTDLVPERVTLQCQTHMLAAEQDTCHVVALLGGRGFVGYRIHRHEALIKVIVEAVDVFWNEHIVPRVPPVDYAPSLDIVKAIHREPGSIVEIEPALFERWDEFRQARLVVKKAEDAAYARVLAAMGDAEGAHLGDMGELTYFEQNSSPKVDFAKLRADGLFDTYCTQGKHRVLRHKKNRSLTK